jgi:hypothetical protein
MSIFGCKNRRHTAEVYWGIPEDDTCEVGNDACLGTLLRTLLESETARKALLAVIVDDGRASSLVIVPRTNEGGDVVIIGVMVNVGGAGRAKVSAHFNEVGETDNLSIALSWLSSVEAAETAIGRGSIDIE